jgi:predicted DNA-binding transcriptional regulator AlpA
MNRMVEKKLCDLEEVLQIIPMSKAGIYLACSKGDIPTVRVGRRVFVPSWWIDQILSKPADVPGKGA